MILWKLTLIVAITLSTAGLFTATGQAKTDALLSVWKDTTLPAQERLIAIGDYAWIKHISTRPDSAYHYAQMQFDLAKKKGNTEQMAKALDTQAMSLLRRGRNTEAIEYYERSLILWKKLGNSENTAHAISNLASAHAANGDYAEALSQYALTFDLWDKVGNGRYKGLTLERMGSISMTQGNYPVAVDYFIKALTIQESAEDRDGMARSYNNLGIINSYMKDYRAALEYYSKSLKIKEEAGQKVGAANTLGNMGMLLFRQKDYESALVNFERSLAMLEEAGQSSGVAACLNNIGMLHHQRDDHQKAYDCYVRSLGIYEELSDRKGITNVLFNMSETLDRLGRKTEARESAERALELARNMGLVSEMKNTGKTLYSLYKESGQTGEALEMYELYVTMRDSLTNEENQKEVMRQQFQYDYEKKENAIQKEMELSALKFEYEKKQAAARTEKEKQQLRFEEELKRTLIEADFTRRQAAIEAEQKQKDALARAEQEKKDLLALEQIRRKNIQRNAFIGGFALMLLLAGVFFMQRNRISMEKARSDELLLNILPEETAEELKSHGKARSRLVPEASVLFTDFKGFTALSEKLGPRELVEMIDMYFRAFDRIIQANGLEKIKTIGDAYMAAGGLPVRKYAHPADTVRAALQIRDATDAIRKEMEAQGKPFFQIRIGIHTGPLIAGVVGEHKFQYDIWGDTVNTASRMESSGDVGKVNISEDTYELVKDQFECTYRGEVEAKGKGKIKMYFAESLKA